MNIQAEGHSDDIHHDIKGEKWENVNLKIKSHDAEKASCTYYLLYRFWGRFIAL